MYLFVNPSEAGKIHLSLLSAKAKIASIVLGGGHKVTEKLTEGILKFLKKNKISFTDLSAIILVTGPGGFTSLRICCVIVNTIAQIYKIKVYGSAQKNLDTDKKILSAAKKAKRCAILLPAYDREPNITMPK